MTIAAFEAQASWLPTVVGRRCSAIRTDGGKMLSLHFGEHHETRDGEIEAERTITVEGAWRVESSLEVIAGSADPDDERLEYLELLVDKSLDRIDVTRPGYDLALFFQDGYVVRCFPVDSLEYAEDVEDLEDVEVSWWVTGAGIPDDWESANAASDP
ncbi:MAG TPA: hypothetical protein VMM78_11835 [Thermomicrobiales bacterium]|nr:hypothetical protein [Thermomicrobiales bacterium]